MKLRGDFFVHFQEGKGEGKREEEHCAGLLGQLHIVPHFVKGILEITISIGV